MFAALTKSAILAPGLHREAQPTINGASTIPRLRKNLTETTPTLPTQPPGAPPGFHLLAKPSGSTCNLDCTYCFFLSKERCTRDKQRMAEAMLETYIRQLLEAHRTPEVTVAWQGGEPTLMGLDFFERSVRYRAVPQAGPGRAAHLSDQRHAAGRRLVRVLQGQRPGRPERRWPARTTRRLPADRAVADLRSGDARGAGTSAARGRLQRAVYGTRRQPGARPYVYRFFRDELGGHADAVHPDRRARHRRQLRSPTSAGAISRAASACSTRRPGDLVTERSVASEQYRSLPRGRFRGMGAPRHRSGLRAAVRRDARSVFRPPPAVHPRADLRLRAGTRAQRRSLLVRPLRRAASPVGQHPHDPHADARGLARAAQVRRRQTRHA